MNIGTKMVSTKHYTDFGPRAFTPEITFHTADTHWSAAEPRMPTDPQHIRHVMVEFNEYAFSHSFKLNWMAKKL